MTGLGREKSKRFILKAQLETVGCIRGEQQTCPLLSGPSGRSKLHPIVGVGSGQTPESKVEGSSLPWGQSQAGAPDACLALRMFTRLMSPTTRPSWAE